MLPCARAITPRTSRPHKCNQKAGVQMWRKLLHSFQLPISWQIIPTTLRSLKSWLKCLWLTVQVLRILLSNLVHYKSLISHFYRRVFAQMAKILDFRLWFCFKVCIQRLCVKIAIFKRYAAFKSFSPTFLNLPN